MSHHKIVQEPQISKTESVSESVLESLSESLLESLSESLLESLLEIEFVHFNIHK